MRNTLDTKDKTFHKIQNNCWQIYGSSMFVIGTTYPNSDTEYALYQKADHGFKYVCALYDIDDLRAAVRLFGVRGLNNEIQNTFKH